MVPVVCYFVVVVIVVVHISLFTCCCRVAGRACVRQQPQSEELPPLGRRLGDSPSDRICATTARGPALGKHMCLWG